MRKSSMKNKTANNKRARCSSRLRFKYQIKKWLNDLVEDLLKVLSNFKTVMVLHNKDFNVDKPRQ